MPTDPGRVPDGRGRPDLPMARGPVLYRLVEQYAGLGEHHRTGTPPDELTIDWFASALRDTGADVQVLPYTFDRYDARWELTLDGDPVTAIPLFFEGVGDVVSKSPLVAKVPVQGGAGVPRFTPIAERAVLDGAEAAVIATDVPGGWLCAVNRDTTLGSGLPTLCVAGREAERLMQGRIRMEMHARVVDGRSANVIAKLGDGPEDQRVLLSTPLSGWFTCAGERGTGIAVCLEVARELSRSHPVTVLGTNGHEHQGIGVRRWLHESSPPEKAAFHFGASVASGNADGLAPPTERSPNVRPTAWAGDDRRNDLAAALAPLELPVRLPSDDEVWTESFRWIGESAEWAQLRRPLVSIAGGFPLHHAPEDVPHLATTPDLLEKSFRAALGAARILAQV